MTAAGQRPSPSDLFYRVLQLFILGGGDVNPPVPWQLDVARFLAPAIAAYATFAAAAALLGGRLSAARARLLSGHAVVCGLGPVGARLAESLRRGGYRVVAIERDPVNPRISACRDLGVIVLVGDETDSKLLRSARVDHAAYLFAATDDDSANSEIARAAQVLGTPVDRALTCFVNMHDQTLHAAVKQFAIGHGKDDTFRLESFRVAERAAAALLDRHMPAQAGQARLKPHIVVVGTGDLAIELIVETARRWRKERGEAGHRNQVTVVGAEAEERVAALMERYPQLEKVSEITPLSMSLDSAAFTSAAFLRRDDDPPTATAVYVCVADDARGMSAGIHLRNCLSRADVPIVVCTATGRSGVASLIYGRVDGELDGKIDTFGLLDCLGDIAVVLEGNNETVAQAIHADYVRQESEHGATVETNPVLVPWSLLDLPTKESNRRAAADVGRKLAAINCGLEPLTDWDEPTLEFTAQEVERLAEMEHDRWWESRKATGWEYAPTGDTERKKHPDMTPYRDLPEETKDRDRIQVRRIPYFLHELDFRVVRRMSGSSGG